MTKTQRKAHDKASSAAHAEIDLDFVRARSLWLQAAALFVEANDEEYVTAMLYNAEQAAKLAKAKKLPYAFKGCVKRNAA